ncbi:bifunctional DNA-binding transcriptional regulator/O6-methylguanine-DNA methyltransferase Ada [Pseudomonas aegrilactucae]|uniref:Bifunctional DNA-binding transcriptional regulator/O6-methylguanine-DNA methyltransferase Ada n=1 Tax=Pseudomonas aegrilactucae TaxID=2854028 RepID=A0A9Q2XKV3_9PSED|nr:bifunctional DNA-binding transcriptional regulator/O6-methylguanine-DNA methyltransferase Ada [Pseudomonas aegrilactucae]MBV6288553.1 bifunctional DNA-binding transcriptional regulator/O6-methylguanine-DNA methyltransferase Ada [Pseudomonas aegrilactucae]
MSRKRPISATDPRWQALLARDPAADPLFVYGVRTTGVYCRASSPSRLPRIENVEFFDTAEQAEAAGYRPSRRRGANHSQVAEQHAAQVTRACQLIEQAETEPNLKQLAAHVSMSPYHFHRVFKAATGLTPKAYAGAHRAHKVRSQLTQANSITDALYEAGYNSNSRFYEASAALLGMTPGAYRAGGVNARIRFAIAQCSLGAILVAQSERGVCAILLGDDAEVLLHDLQDKFPKAELIGADAAFEQRVARVVGFVEAPALGLDLPLDLRGTAFQQRVWQALCSIPPGSTASYADIAQRIGAPKAVRAVAQACAANSLAVAVPCHRVVRSDGNLSGYRWGVERKKALLERERN